MIAAMSSSSEKQKLLILILNKPECLQALFSVLVELGISGATVLDSEGMGKILAQDIPIFAGVKNLFSATRPKNKTILIVLHEEMIPLVAQAFEETVGPLSEPGNGIVLSMPVDLIKGGAENPQTP